MSTAATGRRLPRFRLGEVRRRVPAPFGLVVTVAVLTAAVDAFWMTGLQGAVGAIERAQSPLRLWLVATAVAIPLYLVALVGALLLARRGLTGRGLAWLRRLAGVVLLVAVTTAVGMVGLGANAAWDYHAQTQRIAADHAHSEALVQGNDGQIQVGSIVVPGCYGDCAVRSQTRETHFKALRLGGKLLVGTNTVLVLWVIALWGGVSFTSTARRTRVRALARTGDARTARVSQPPVAATP